MTVLVLGGTGYLGSKFISSMIAKGNKVICARRNESKLKYLSDFETEIQWVTCTEDSLDKILKCDRVDAIINFITNYGRNFESYEEVIESNIEIPLCVLKLAMRYEISQFITIGTGLPDYFNLYSFSKKVFADFGKFFAEKNNINFCNVKLEMFYGDDEPLDRFIPSVVYKMILGNEVNTTIGEQRRDIISAEDVVKAIIMIIDSKLLGYNDISVGTGVAPTVAEIVDFIWDNTGKKSIVNKGNIPSRENEPDCVADTAFLQSLGEWKPIVWKDGILEIIKKMKSRYGD